jgi:hypothetical protein
MACSIVRKAPDSAPVILIVPIKAAIINAI